MKWVTEYELLAVVIGISTALAPILGAVSAVLVIAYNTIRIYKELRKEKKEDVPPRYTSRHWWKSRRPART